MLILRLWNYMRGYVIINIEGLNLEKFINSCIQNNIYLWNIKRVKATKMEAYVGIKGYKALRRHCKKLGCRVYIAKKNGYPFLAHRVKKRKMLMMGAFFSLLLILLASSFIYSIDIVGNEKVDTLRIRNVLMDVGLKPGANRYVLNLREIENQILIEFNEFAWVGIELRGIYARVEVVEKLIPESKIDKTTPCHVVARKNGVIDRVIARNGDAVVKKGDIVAEGDLLITGVVKRDGFENPILVHSYGEVYARTYYETVRGRHLTEIKKEKTGEIATITVIKLGNFSLSLGDKEIPFGNYIIEKDIKKLTIWRNISIPVEIKRKEYFEVIDVKVDVDLDEAKHQMHQEAIQYLMMEIPEEAEIYNTIIDFKVIGDTLQGKFTIEVIEDIALQQKIDHRED